jgi:hypothetical protein
VRVRDSPDSPDVRTSIHAQNVLAAGTKLL